jgi:hypothetical protein
MQRTRDTLARTTSTTCVLTDALCVIVVWSTLISVATLDWERDVKLLVLTIGQLRRR